ncbi:MAG: nucleotidyltransferase family protein [Armatimonadetes bacterium]|nr:nucleotidyltransferase family protein [Armatimonadota bacterium]
MADVTAVVLAAGLSSRHGTNKLLCLRDGVPLVRLTVSRVRNAVDGRVVVVLGHEADRVRDALGPEPVVDVLNNDYAVGMSTSIRAGVESVRPESAVLIVLADMPWIEEKTVSMIVAAYRGAGDTSAIVVPCAEGRTGNPVLFGPAHRDALLALQGDRGAKAVIEASASHVIRVAVGPQELEDVDGPAGVTADR